MPGIEEYYQGKRLLVIGATGLIGRVLIEKLLRDLTSVERIYVLIRPRHRGDKTILAHERMWQELFTSSAFDRLRLALGADFTRVIEAKVEAVSGDLSHPRLGLDDATYGRLQQEIDLVINCAGLVSFDAPLDAALKLNTLGPMSILDFAKGTHGAAVAHISTCYVNSTRDGTIAEEPIDPARLAANMKGATRLPRDIDGEVEAVQRRTQKVQQQANSLPHRLTFALKARIRLTHRKPTGENGYGLEADRFQQSWVDRKLVSEGMRWAHRRGFNDTYTLTKAMGEQLVLRHRGEVPTLILRPSVVESALETPEPGWLDGMRMMDPLIVAYGRNLVPDFPGRAEGVIDVVPVDVVVNALLAIIPSIAVHGGIGIYHIASGTQNPLQVKRFTDLVRESYHRENPGSGSSEPNRYPEITFPTTRDFLRRLRYHYALPLMLLSWLPAASYLIPRGRRIRSSYRAKRIGLEKLAYYARIYGPYAEAKCRYLTNRTLQVWNCLNEEERQKFNFDVNRIDWREYIQNIHIPGLKKFVLGPRPSASRPANVESNGAGAVSWPKEGSGEGNPAKVATATAVEAQLRDAVSADKAPSSGLTNHVVQAVPAQNGHSQRPGFEDAHPSAREPSHWNRHIALPRDGEMDRWIRGGERWTPARKMLRLGAACFLRVFNRLSSEGLENVPSSGPFILAANHCSHFDTGVLMVLLARGGKVHPLAAKDYFFRNRVSGWVVRNLVDVAPFDRHSHTPDSLSLALGLLSRDHSLVYFPEGGRSPDGVMQKLKPGVGLLALESGAPVVPAYISGSYQVLPKGHTVPKPSHIHVRFGPPLHCESFLRSTNGESANELVRRFTEEIEKAVQALS